MKTQSEATHLPTDIRPTLVVGLGGTGQRIVLQLKSQFIKAYGGIPEQFIRLLAFDTADEALSVNGQACSVTLEKDREFFHIGHTPVPNIVRNLDRQPAIAARLPAIHTIPAVALRNGARQVRPLGLLALLWRFEEVEQRIADAIWHLAGKESLGRREGKTQGVNVIVATSLVGGTGAGMFLDVAYLVRALFNELGTMGDFCYITGVGVLPQAFRSVEGPNLVPNAVAALKEVSHCMLHGGFSNEYPNGRLIELPNPPFDLFYLIDGVDEQGYTWRGVGDLAAMVAAGLFLQIGSQVGLKGENDFDNLSDVLGGQTVDGQGTFCGSFGMATLTFSGAEVAAWCGARLGGQLIDAGLLQSVADAETMTRAGEFVQAQLPSADALFQLLAQDDTGAALLVDPGAAAWLRQSKRGQLPAEIVRYIHDYEHARVQGDYRAWIRANGVAYSERLAGEVDALVATSLSAADVGVAGTLALIEAVQSLLKTRVEGLENHRTTVVDDQQRLELELAGQEEALREAGRALFLWRSRALGTARDRYIETATAALTRQLEALVYDAALTALAACERAARHWHARLSGIQTALLAVRRQIAHEETAFLARHNGHRAVADITLMDAAYCETLYQRHAPQLPEVLADLLHKYDIASWDGQSTAVIHASLHAVADAAFASVAAMTVEEALRDRADETSPDAQRERLFRLAAPSWNLDLTRLEDGGAHLQNVRVLGVPDDAHSIFQAQTRMLVSTHDPNALTAFVATIGAPYTALQQFPDYERAYRAAKRTRAIHVLPRFQTEDEHAKLAFALGIVYEFIFNRGVYFYYRPEDALDAPFKLDSGLANAVHNFAQYDHLVQEVIARVEQRIAETGTTAALETLTAYYSADGQKAQGKASGGATDPLVVQMRKLVRGYADELHNAQQAVGG
ncbi:MAG: tubulin-like doman-containing protein [Anaerolineae bacterium]